LTVFNHIEDEGAVGSFPAGDQTEATGYQFDFSGQSAAGGHYWQVMEDYDARAATLRFDYSVTTDPQEIRIVLRDSADALIGTFAFDPETGAGIHTQEFTVPTGAAYADVRKIEVIVDAAGSGAGTASFYVHQIQFRHFQLTGELEPDAALDAGDVTSLQEKLGGSPEADPVDGGGGSASVVQTGTTEIDLTYDVQGGAGEFAGVMVHYDDFSTGGTVETGDLTDLDSFVVGIKGPASSKIKVEVEDVNGNKDFIILTDIGTTENFYEIRLDYFSAQIDWSQIKTISFIVDQSLLATYAGLIEIRTAGLNPPTP
jgi:hypothetical protein